MQDVMRCQLQNLARCGCTFLLCRHTLGNRHARSHFQLNFACMQFIYGTHLSIGAVAKSHFRDSEIIIV